MENRKEFTFPSADGRTAIHAVEWHPTGEPAGILQIAHGVAEYALRYEPFARFLNAHGFLVVANDHLGHGESVAEGAPRLYFGEKGSWQHVVDDMYTLRCRTGEAYPELPYFIMGHSMGSFLTRTYLIRYPGTVKGAILMGTGQNPDAMLVGGKALASVLARKVGRENASDVVEKLAFGAYNKAFAPNRTGYDWLSVSEENVDAYIGRSALRRHGEHGAVPRAARRHGVHQEARQPAAHEHGDARALHLRRPRPRGRHGQGRARGLR